MIGLLFLPKDPTLAFWIMVPVFIIDSLLNAGIAIANNGFMLKNSPSETGRCISLREPPWRDWWAVLLRFWRGRFW
jgi:hypothetical protein